MDYLKVPPDKLYRRFQVMPKDYRILSLDILSPYLDISPFTDYLQSLEYIQLKNIWNAIIIQWNNICHDISDNKSYKRSHYSKQKYSQIHKTFPHDKLDDLMHEFISNDIMKGIFVLQCILSYVFPR